MNQRDIRDITKIMGELEECCPECTMDMLAKFAKKYPRYQELVLETMESLGIDKEIVEGAKKKLEEW